MNDAKKEEEARKKIIFDSMSERRQKHILKRGYAEWDPFQEPKDPIDIRQDRTRRTSQMLIREFFQSLESNAYSNEYGRGAFELCMGIINENEKYQGMFDFACWYKDLLIKEGHETE
ncbi:MAG: hypothetical protein COX19_05540 [Desulfobacterales bacterium CG23_combo_of_CG06-09_8_20_14_all_51_8]|nr:MAG: hypothetical protein COX19_05540 [Desulfobacterales bacterium CG23_combo_of_CG06-09_8_20_14_all_51_8]